MMVLNKNRYRELKYFCLQYEDKKKELENICYLTSNIKDNESSNKNIDRNKIEKLTIKKINLEKQIEIIEKTAHEVTEDLYDYLLKNVTQGIPWEYLDIPISRSGFYYLRSRYFYNLSKILI